MLRKFGQSPLYMQESSIVLQGSWIQAEIDREKPRTTGMASGLFFFRLLYCIFGAIRFSFVFPIEQQPLAAIV